MFWLYYCEALVKNSCRFYIQESEFVSQIKFNLNYRRGYFFTHIFYSFKNIFRISKGYKEILAHHYCPKTRSQCARVVIGMLIRWWTVVVSLALVGQCRLSRSHVRPEGGRRVFNHLAMSERFPRAWCIITVVRDGGIIFVFNDLPVPVGMYHWRFLTTSMFFFLL